jgi:hypothetical protein
MDSLELITLAEINFSCKARIKVLLLVVKKRTFLSN